MASPETIEKFVQRLTANQTRLYGYVYSLLADHSRTADVVQETNLVLWRKVHEYEPDREFLPWAFGVARYQVLAHIRDQKRDRLLLDAELVESMCMAAETNAGNLEEVRSALRFCLESVAADNRGLLDRRYSRSMAIAEISAEVKRSVSAVKVALMRTRQQLAKCVQRRLAVEG